jgi:hypothetical protein
MHWTWTQPSSGVIWTMTSAILGTQQTIVPKSFEMEQSVSSFLQKHHHLTSGSIIPMNDYLR